MSEAPASGREMHEPWIALTAEAIGAIPAQLGVFQIADADEAIVFIGFAGGHELFGLRSALDKQLNRGPDHKFRVEFTHGYLTRWEELLMVYQAQHGELPPGNTDHVQKLGRLTLGA